SLDGLKLQRIRLEAPVAGSPPHLLSQEEFAALCNVDKRTLRHWVRRGCPVDRRGKHPRYPAEAFSWYLAYRLATERGEPPKFLSRETAIDQHLHRQYQDSPRGFVLVPLDWDHPAREEQLRRAAAGTKPPEDLDA
ncbi:MAG: hypothetical protein ACT4PM_02495, partial [Gemmatimonadales bacterium]